MPDPISIAEIPPYRLKPIAPVTASLHGNLAQSLTRATNSARAVDTPLATALPRAAVSQRPLAEHFAAASSQTKARDAASLQLQQPAVSMIARTTGEAARPRPRVLSPAESKFAKKFGTQLLSPDPTEKNPRLNDEMVKQDAREKLERDNYRAFCTVYCANNKSAVINLARRTGCGYSFDTQTILDSLASRDDQFKPTAIERAQLKSFCKLVTKTDLDRIDNYIYRYDANRRTTLYRGQDMTNAGIKQLQGLMKNNISVTPTHFFSCDTSASVADEFAKGSQNGETVPVSFKIDGCSSRRLRGLFNTSGNSESLFSTRATFEIESLKTTPSKDHYFVTLREVPTSNNSVQIPY